MLYLNVEQMEHVDALATQGVPIPMIADAVRVPVEEVEAYLCGPEPEEVIREY